MKGGFNMINKKPFDLSADDAVDINDLFAVQPELKNAADIPDAERIFNDDIPEFENGLTDEVYADISSPDEL